VEISYAEQIDNTGIKAALTQQEPRNADTNELLIRRAKLFANIALSQQMGAWRVAGEWQYSSEREDNDILVSSKRVALAAYNLLNVTALYKLDKHIDMSLRVDNLLDEDYMLAHGYNTLGRTIFVGINYQ
jgi:vitamin B12 transporter